MTENAGIAAQKLWNSTACGELAGDKNSLEYFYAVEKDRYTQQPWAHDYFGYDTFANKKVLEIGIGQGTDLMQFARAGAQCYGADITENHLQLTAKNFELQKKDVTLYNANALSLPFDDNYFDCIYSFGVLHHIEDIDKVISECHRVLKPGGTIMIALYYKWSAFHLFSKILCNGIRCGWLWKKGYKGLLATIETGADGVDVKPYVKLYTKRRCKKLAKDFSIKDISVHQLYPDHFYPKFVQNMMRPFVSKLSSKLGWYVTVKAIK